MTLIAVSIATRTATMNSTFAAASIATVTIQIDAACGCQRTVITATAPVSGAMDSVNRRRRVNDASAPRSRSTVAA